MELNSINMPVFLRNSISSQGIPLWAPKGIYCDNGQQFFDIEVYSDERHVEREKDVGDILNINTLRCHICDIDVPNSYIDKHLQSVKHESFLKITNLALARTQKYLKANLKQSILKLEVKETYFCENCSVVVLNTDKKNHVLTSTHKNCVKNDAHLQNLVKIFENKNPHHCIESGNVLSEENIEVQCKYLKDTLKITENLKSEDGASNETQVIEKNEVIKEGETANVVSINKEIQYIDDKTLTANAERSQSDTANTNAKFINEEKHITNTNAKFPKKKNKNNKSTSKVFNDNDIAADNQDNKNVKVQQQITSVATILEQNKTTSKQIEKESSPVESTSQIKKEPNACTSQTETELCEVKTTLQTEKGLCTTKNTSHYNEGIEDLKRFVELANFLHSDFIRLTVFSEDTVEVVAANLENVRVPIVNFHGYHTTGQDVVCKVCLGINSVNGKKHKWTDLHMKTIMSPLKRGYIRQVSDILLHCILCNTVHAITASIQHVTSAQHANNLQRYSVVKKLSQKVTQMAIANYIKWTMDTMFCKICQIKIEKCNDAVNQHVHSSSHTNEHALLLSLNKIVKVPFEPGRYFCSVCQKIIWPGHLIAHCIYPAHKKKLAASL